MNINRHFRRWYYHIKYRYLSLNNVVLAVALLMAFGWAWGSVSMMQRNYTLQRKLDTKERQLTLNQLEVQNLEFQRNYYQSTEYQELAARRYLGLVNPGEKVLILPPNSAQAKADTNSTTNSTTVSIPQPSNFRQWLDFLSGKNVSRLQ